MTDTDRPDPAARLVRFDWEVTVAFTLLTAVTHALADDLDLVYAVVCSLLFVAGIGLFLLGFWNGVQRSRLEEVTLSGLLAAGRSFVPLAARNRLWAAVVVQVAVAVIAASARPFTQQAFGLLVPMFGIGVAAVWGSRHARFHLRDDT